MASFFDSQDLISNFVYIALLALFLLTLWFRQHKVFLLTTFILFFKLMLDFGAQFTSYPVDSVTLVRGILCLLPANVLLLGIFRRKRMRLRLKLLLLGFFGLQLYGLSQLGAIRGQIINVFPSQFTFELGFIQTETAIILFLAFLVSSYNKFLLSGGFYDLALSSVLVSGLYGYFAPKYDIGLDVLFLSLGLLGLFVVLKDNYQAAYIDQLTGIPSRRALTEMEGQLGSNYVVAMADIDYFKRFNDRYGHDVGDEALAFVAGLLNRNARGSVFRYGGEEFTLVFPKASLSDCLQHLDEVRKIVAESKFKIRGRKTAVSITVSIGAAEFSDKHNSFEAVLKAADQALYRAKKKGRNRVSK